ncbi:MAG: hypothetical protein SFU99_20845 [Saprospiraceae bacterium]|nr:hypothetical protein [Saprospiraceae bacterium]
MKKGIFTLQMFIAVEINSIFDEALRELDEFNKRAQAEEMEE